MKKIIIFALLQTVLLCANAQTFHAIVFCNTSDRSIGESMSVELANVSRNLGVLERLLEDDYLFEITRIDGPNCTGANLRQIINAMEVGPDDVVFTFYGGHGSHAPNNAEDPWPQYCMNTGDQSKWIPMAQVEKWIAQKNPRLRIIMSNCCNKEQEGVTIKPMWANDERATRLDGLNANAFRKLFSSKGCVMSTSSKLGQYSWCNQYGGLFTNQFWAAMQQLGEGKIQPDWNSLLRVASADLYANTENGRVTQTPYYKVSLSNGNGNGGGSGATRRPPVNNDNETLNQALSKLVNKSIDQDSRLSMIPTIMRKFFNSSSKVITIASDMTTGVDFEDAEDFLRRICLSPYVSGITLLNDDTNMLKVHELR